MPFWPSQVRPLSVMARPYGVARPLPGTCAGASAGYRSLPAVCPNWTTLGHRFVTGFLRTDRSAAASHLMTAVEALDRLEARRPDLVAPMVLRDICQLDYREIATHLGIPEGTVKSRIHEARRRLRERLG